MKKQLLLTVACVFAFASGVKAADNEVWQLVTDTQERVVMSNVDYLLASDEAEVFSVVLKEGEMINNVTRVTFVKEPFSTVSELTKSSVSVFPTVVESTLTLSGCEEGEAVRIVSMQGMEVKQVRTSAGETVVEVGDLPSGYYLLSVGETGTTVKFIKK